MNSKMYTAIAIVAFISSIEMQKLVNRGVNSRPELQTTIIGFGQCDRRRTFEVPKGCKCPSQQIFYMDEKKNLPSCYSNTEMLVITGCGKVYQSDKGSNYRVNQNPTCKPISISVWDSVNKNNPWNDAWSSDLLPVIEKALLNEKVDTTSNQLEGLLVRVSYAEECDSKCDLINYLDTKAYPLTTKSIFPLKTEVPNTPNPSSTKTDTNPTSSSSSSSDTGTIVGVIVAVLLIILIVVIIVYLWKKQKIPKIRLPIKWKQKTMHNSNKSNTPVYAVYDASVNNTKSVDPTAFSNQNIYDIAQDSMYVDARTKPQVISEPQTNNKPPDYNYAYTNNKFEAEDQNGSSDVVLPIHHDEDDEEEVYHSDDSTDENFYYDPAINTEDEITDPNYLPEYAVVNKNKT